MNMLKEKFNTVYYPPEHITVDESLVLFKVRLLFKQYIKSKRPRFGIKLYELSMADGILLDFILYQGNIEPSLIQPPGEGWLQTERIPLTLIDPCLDRGHTLTIYNFYTTPRLAKYLLERKTKTVGTIRHNRKTDHDGNILQKPDPIIYYNKNMGGVDMIDQQLDSINIIRKSFKWYHKVFFRLFSVAMLSSYKIYKEKGGKYEFLQFVHDIVLGLVENSPQLTRVARKSDNLV